MEIGSLNSSLMNGMGNRTISANNPAVKGAESLEEPSKSVLIEITPGEENVDSGDRSENTARIDITTPNRELSAEVSREGVFDVVERRARKRRLESLAPGDDDGPSRREVLLIKSDEGGQSSQELIMTSLKKEQAEIYAEGIERANEIYGETGSSSSSGDGSDTAEANEELAQAFLDAKNAYNKQQFIFSTIDRVGTSIKA